LSTPDGINGSTESGQTVESAPADPGTAAPAGIVPAQSGPPGVRKRIKGHGLQHAIGSATAAVMLVIVALVGAALVIRVGAVTPFGLSVVERVLTGLKVDRAGHLMVSGLKGDPFGRFSASWVGIRDADGVWIEARNVRGEWSPAHLALGIVRFESATSDGVVMIRRPILLPEPARHRESPVTVQVENIHSVAVTRPAVSVVEGVFDVTGRFELVPGKGIRTRADVRSRGPNRDFVTVQVRARRGEPVLVDVRARGAQGGAVAGLAGLDPARPFAFDLLVSDIRHVSTITLFATSGPEQIADLSGTLSREGGAVAGTIRLDASLLTRSIAQRVGPRVVVDARLGQEQPGGSQQLTAVLDGERARLQLQGPIRRSSGWVADGITANLDVADLGALTAVGGLSGAALSLDGRASGGIANLYFDGALEVTGLVSGGYRLNRVAGPLALKVLDGQGLQITMDLAGQGSGTGPLNQWLGRAPTLKARLRQFDNGGWAIEDGQLTGAGLTASGSGGLDLLGRVRSSGTAIADARGTGVAGATGRLPFDWSLTSIGPGVFAVEAKGAGAGFATSNAWLDAILGLKPRFDVALEVGGPQAVFNRLKLDLEKLQIDASGRVGADGRPVLAGRFDGDLSAVGLERLNGMLAGRFTAGPASNGGLQIGFEGRSRSFMAGLGPLDPLVGADPAISGTIVSRGPEILLSDLVIAGRQLDASTSGRIQLDGDIALALTWNARGPIQVGPLEVGGSPTGTGTVTGPIRRPVLMISAQTQSLALPQITLDQARFGLVLPLVADGVGTVTLSGATPYGPISGNAEVRPGPETLQLDDLTVTGAGVSLSGQAAIRSAGGLTGRFDVVATSGLFISSGSVRGRLGIEATGGQPQVSLALSGDDVILRSAPGVRFATLAVDGRGTAENLPLTVRARIAGESPVTVNGNVLVTGGEGRLSLSATGSGTALGLTFSTATPLRLTSAGDRVQLDGNVRFSSAGSAQSGYLALDLTRDADRLNASLTVENVSLALLNGDLTGQFSASGRLEGRGSRLTGDFDARLVQALSRGLPSDLALSGSLTGRLDDSRLALNGELANARGLALALRSAIPVEATAAPLRLALVRNGPISGTFSASGEVRPVADLLFAGERTLNGPVEAQGTIGGTLNDPALAGSVKLTGGDWLEPRIGLRMTALDLDAAFEGDVIVVRQLRARDGAQGRVEGSGRIQLGDGPVPSTFEATLRRFRLFDTETGEASADGTVRIERYGDGRAELTGRLQIENAEFRPARTSPDGAIALDVVEINRPQAVSGPLDPSLIRLPQLSGGRNAPAIRLNVELAATRGIFVRGRGLNLELDLDARVTGTSSRPVLSGEARVFRGSYTYGGRVFDFQEGGSITLAADPDNIRLDLVAVRDADDLEARIVVTGTARDPRVTLTSTPPLPQDEVLSRVLFGRSTAQLTGGEAVQLAAGLAALAGGDSFDVVANLRDLVALDRLTFAYGAAGLEVTGGKYLGRDFYLELINEPEIGIISQVEWRPIRRLAITSRISPDGDARISVRWRQSVNR
jgi:translocation and assembly module TamB